MGRPTKPTELKRKLGNPGKQKLPEPVLVLPASGAPPPAPVGLRARGKATWARYWTLGAGWLSPTTDRELLARLCRLYDDEDALSRQVRREGFTVVSGRGAMQNPALLSLRKTQELITRLEGLCGFTPSDRSRLGMAEVQRTSKLDALIEKRRAAAD